MDGRQVTLKIDEIHDEFIHKQLIITDMKIISIIGLMLALIGIVVGLYCQLEIMPNYYKFYVQSDLSEMDRVLFGGYSDQKFVIGNIALFLGASSSIMGLIVGVEKQKKGWLILILGLISFVLGVM